jgi:hypothetical protein
VPEGEFVPFQKSLLGGRPGETRRHSPSSACRKPEAW